jgi:hypothetical protein
MVRGHRFINRVKGALFLEDRLAETWMDDNYKKYYYRLRGDTKNRNHGDITKNLENKKKANCKSFSWYVENVLKEIEIPDRIKDENWLTTTTTTTTTEPPTTTTIKIEKLENKNENEVKEVEKIPEVKDEKPKV